MIQNTTIQSGITNQGYRTNQTQDVLPPNQARPQSETESSAYFSDRVTLSYRVESIELYDSSMTLQPQQNELDLLRGYVRSIFEKHGLDLTIQTDDSEINLDELSQEEAAELISEEGYFGVEQTSDRIVDFAMGLAGGDPSRIEAIKTGVEQGFNEALEAFGGWLPDISYDTYDAVMNKLDEWANQDEPQSS